MDKALRNFSANLTLRVVAAAFLGPTDTHAFVSHPSSGGIWLLVRFAANSRLRTEGCGRTCVKVVFSSWLICSK
eukprot:6472761-Amphidinium_carterae.1